MLRALLSKLLQRALARLDAVRARFGRTIKLTAAAAGILLAAAILGLFGAIGLAVAAGLALAIVIPGWASALVLAGLLLLLAAAAAAAAMRTFRIASRSRSAGPGSSESRKPSHSDM
jgi:Putative Actinobacterial Holin-X, holin superfamily III